MREEARREAEGKRRNEDRRDNTERQRENGGDDLIAIRASYSHSEKNTDSNRD